MVSSAAATVKETLESFVLAKHLLSWRHGDIPVYLKMEKKGGSVYSHN